MNRTTKSKSMRMITSRLQQRAKNKIRRSRNTEKTFKRRKRNNHCI